MYMILMVFYLVSAAFTRDYGQGEPIRGMDTEEAGYDNEDRHTIDVYHPVTDFNTDVSMAEKHNEFTTYQPIGTVATIPQHV